MTLQSLSETITMHVLPNVSPSKDNQTMKFGQIIEYKNAENKIGRLVADLFLFSKKVLYEVKASGLQLSFNVIR